MHTYTDLYLAHPLETWTPFGIVVNSAYALLTMPVTYKPTNVVNSPFIRYSGTSAYKWSIISCANNYKSGNGTGTGRRTLPVLRFFFKLHTQIPGAAQGHLDFYRLRIKKQELKKRVYRLVHPRSPKFFGRPFLEMYSSVRNSEHRLGFLKASCVGWRRFQCANREKFYRSKLNWVSSITPPQSFSFWGKKWVR